MFPHPTARAPWVICYTMHMAFDPNKITFFAKTDARGKNVQFGIKAKDRQRHVYVIGKTGMGKSTLLENMAVQDIQNGEGMAFIDPHGSAAETLLNYIPEHRINDVLYFAPFDTNYPVSFNIMEDVGPDKRHLVVSGLMSVFKKIWIDAWSARMEYILSNTLLALLEYPDSTLLGVNRMLSDKDYRKVVVDNVKDPGVRSFWVDEFAKYNERYMQEAGDAIKNKIGQFTSNPIIRNIVGQPKSSFDIRKMMDDKKILIINLSKGLIGESNANLLGSMLTTRIYLAAMSRADLSPAEMREMPNFYFYVDEFQSFANATFANILSEARKYHLNLTIAHQYVTQMEEEVRDAVFGNVGTIISFRVGPLDAELLETIFTPQFLATDIVNLSFAQIYLTLMIDGIGSQPFSATTLPPIAPPAVSCRDMAIEASRFAFTRPRAEVEEMVHKFHEPVVVPKKEDRRERPDGAVLPARPREDRPRAPVRAEEERRERPDGAVFSARPREDRPRAPVRAEEERRERPRPAPVEVSVEEQKRAEEPRREKPDQATSAIDRSEKPKTQSNQKQTPSTDDLKSILRRIGATPGEGAPVEKKETPNRVELKSLLSTVLSEERSVAPQVSEERKEEVVVQIQRSDTDVFQNSSVKKSETSNREERSTTSPRGKETVPHRTPHVGNGDTKHTHPSPKELERMMRVTTNDKPPFG